MANINNIKELNLETLRKILEACDKTFTSELGLKTSDVGQVDWKIPEIGFSYKRGDELTKKNFFIYLEELTDTKNIRFAYSKIFEEIESRTKEASRPKEQEKTTLGENELKKLQEEQFAKETKRKETIDKSKVTIEEAITKKQELKKQQDLLNKKIEESKKIETELKDSNNQDKKVFAKVETKNPPKFSVEEQTAFDVYKNEIKTNPKEALNDLSKVIEERITPELIKQGVKIEEIKLVSNQTSTKIVENIIQIDLPSYVPPLTQTAILGEISKDTKVLPKILTNKETLNIFQNSVNDIAATTVVTDEVCKNVTKMAFGENFALTVFGVEPDQVVVTLSETPEPEFNTSVNFNNLNQNYQNSLKEQDNTFESVKDLGRGKTKEFLYKKAGTYLEERVANLAPQSVAGRVLQSTEAKSLFFSTFRVGSPVTWEATNWVGNLTLKFAPEYAPILSGISKLTGINFGIAPAAITAIEVAPVVGVTVVETAPVIGALAVEGVATTGAQVAAPVVAKVAGGLLPKVIAAFTALGGWVTFGISTVVGLLLGKLIEKINWKKVKENVLPVIAVGGGLLIGGPVGLTMIGGGLFAFKKVRRALKTGSFFAKLGSIFGRLAITITTPVIVTLLIIPPTVAFFMFIINSGAYIVPQGGFGQIPRGGNLTKCDPEITGKEITHQLASSIKSGSVRFLPMTLGSRQQGVCMDPTMIILHTSAGIDNDQGNDATYGTLVQKNVSCQMATDTNDTIFMLSFFEKQVEYSWCANNLNAGGISTEMAGECPSESCRQYSICGKDVDLIYTPDGPHPCPSLEDLSFDAICKVMQQYKIPWTQIFQHEASNGSHTDPVGDEWVDKFILRLKNNCKI